MSSVWPWAYDLESLCAAPTHANSVGQAWTAWESMASITVKALATMHPCHSALNNIIQLKVFGFSKDRSSPGASGDCRADRKQPDGATVMPWRRGRILIWDVTCPDTLAPSHQQLALREAGVVAGQAERRKAAKYAELAVTHHFIPVAVETTGVFGPEAHSSS